jgi:hypothetical protein
LRTGSPSNSGCNILGIDNYRFVISGTLITSQRVPVGNGTIPILTRRTHGTSLEIGVGYVIRSNDTGTGTGFNGHVGNGHASLHGEGFHGTSGKFNGVTGTSSGSNDSNNVQNKILGSDTLLEIPVNANEHVLSLGLSQSLYM